MSKLYIITTYISSTYTKIILGIKLRNLYGFTVYIGSIKSFICPTNAHINYFKIIEVLKTFKITTLAPTCFGLHKYHHGSPVCASPKLLYWFQLYTHMSLMKFSVLWLHILFSPVVCVCVSTVHCAEWVSYCAEWNSFCTVQDTHTHTHTHT